MPEYTLRNVDPQLWSQFTERANREGWRMRALMVGLMEAYARGHFTPPRAPPRELPEFGWLRAHYRQISQEPEFSSLDADAQWERLIQQVLHSDAAMEWRVLGEVPVERRSEILGWLHHTMNVPTAAGLTLRAIAHIGEGSDLQTNRRAFQFEVLGPPHRQQAWVADFDAR